MKRLLLALLLFPALGCAQAPVAAADDAPFTVATLARGLERPWGAAFLPDGRLLVTERPGRIRLVGVDGQVSPPLSGVPAVEARGQGGLLDIALAPDFASSREVWFCQAALVDGGALTRFVRARLSGDATALEAVTPVLDATPAQRNGRNHYGCRIAFAPDGRHVFLSTGERFSDKSRAQRLDDLAGKVLRLTRNGTVPADNPFVGRDGARGEIWSLGHRNPQGLAFNPATGTLFEAEFGPLGGDEVNVIERGANYGWPVVTHGRNYDGSIISNQRSAPGFVDPARVWTPVINLSGIAFYDAGGIPGWRGSLLLAGLTGQLVRLRMEGDRILGEERVLQGSPRMRHVLVSPAGHIHILTDEEDGRILRLDPR